MSDELKWTPARRRALAVLAEAPQTGPGGVRISNRTAGAPTWCVYWQMAEWLAEQGLAELDLTIDGTHCAWITDHGRGVAVDG